MSDDNVVNIFDKSSNLNGEAKCLCCDHKWQAVAPIGAVELECPKCHTFRGVYIGMTAPERVIECDCGNQHFYISAESDVAVCARCGLSLGV